MPMEAIRGRITMDNGECKIFKGIIAGCVNTEILYEPKPYSEIKCLVNSLTDIIVDIDKSTEEYYFICTSSGIEGFCHRKYVVCYDDKEV